VTSSRRDFTPSLRNRLVTWLATVRTADRRSAAISAFVRPHAMRSAISDSAGLSGSPESLGRGTLRIAKSSPSLTSDYRSGGGGGHGDLDRALLERRLPIPLSCWAS
jgi:hypothetical protein